ncbi:MAG: radical SAM protein [Pyrinomonadaceae bacterium]
MNVMTTDLPLNIEKRKRKLMTGIDFLWLEITSKCNLYCGHCYADSGPHSSLHGEMQLKDWINILSEAASLGCRQAQFIGGEPTLHPNLTEMINRAVTDFGYQTVEVFTNGTNLSAELIKFFTNKKVTLATSFYSDDAEVHDRITNRAGSFTRTVEGIRRAVEAGIFIRAGVIETIYNRGHYGAAKSFLNNIGVKQIGYDRERGIGRGANAQVAIKSNPMKELCGRCWQGKLCVTADAKTFPCVFSRFLDLGDPREGLDSILKSKRLNDFRAEMSELFPAKFVGDEIADSPTACQPDIPCSPDQCEPASGCDPSGPCEPGCPCTPEEPACSPQNCLPNEPCNPNLA